MNVQFSITSNQTSPKIERMDVKALQSVIILHFDAMHLTEVLLLKNLITWTITAIFNTNRINYLVIDSWQSFSVLLSHPTQPSPNDPKSWAVKLLQRSDSTAAEVFRYSIKYQRNTKTPERPADLLESVGVPIDWRAASLLPLFKKRDCSNYKSTCNIGKALKTATTLILKSLQTQRYQRTQHANGCLRPGRGGIDQIFNLRRVLE